MGDDIKTAMDKQNNEILKIINKKLDENESSIKRQSISVEQKLNNLNNRLKKMEKTLDVNQNNYNLNYNKNDKKMEKIKKNINGISKEIKKNINKNNNKIILNEIKIINKKLDENESS